MPQAMKRHVDTDSFPTLKEVEIAHIRAAFEHAGGNVTHAAKLLGVNRRTLYRRAPEAGIECKLKGQGTKAALRAALARIAELEASQ
jgi:transcriptional regulator of acetoin/glycerol metabolism